MRPPSIFIAMLGTLAATLTSTAPTFAAQASTSLSVCGTQAAPAAISVPVPADYPRIAAEQNSSGTALVRVDLADTGAIRNATLFESSGNELLDPSPRLPALRQPYSPQIFASHPVSR